MILGLTESDGFAFSMIAILGLSFSFVLVIFVGIVRQARKSDPEIDELTDEPRPEKKAQPAGDPSEKEKSEPWEKKDDWWKHSS